ncbi:MAG: hypothetical protein HONDAALG_02311 [Gammaproteobacteria bacterium]|nr:hypothetical protein [Gammaproteobacteria bacterium]
MSEMNELTLQARIDAKIGRLVECAEGLITDRLDKIKEVDGSQRIAGSQIRNVMAVANTAPHPAVVTNFIRYQMGRSGAPSNAWKNTKLGEAVITIIDGELQKLAKEIVSDVSDCKESKEIEMQMQMTRLLLGFMYRRYVYEKPESEAKNALR